MKILIILDQFANTNANRPLLDDALFFRRQGIDTLVATFFPEDLENTLYQESFFSKATFSCLALGSLWNPRSWRKVMSHISKEKPDVVILGEGKAKAIGVIAARLSRVRNIFIFSHDEETIRARRSFFGDIFYAFVHVVIVTSDTAKEYLLRHDMASASKIAVVPDGISDRYGKRPERDIRKSFGIAETEFIFLFIGDFLPEKGIDVLLRAFSKVSLGCLILVGDGPEKKNMEVLSKNLGLGEKVIFLPSYPDIPGLLMTAGVMIVPSKNEENISLFLPAFLSNLPVIAADFPGVEEIVRKGENGIIVRKQDSEDLAGAMNLIASDPALRASLQKNTMKELERFSISAHCAKLLSLAEPKKK